MIYLIDDNKFGQMSENYKVDFTTILDSYPAHLNWLNSILEINLDSIVRNAACILIHDSMDPKEAKERLIGLSKKYNIPYCQFSNGFTATVFENGSIREIKKDRLYNNLLAFIDHFKHEGEVDLKLLSFGANYEVEKASIIQDRLINGTLFKYKDNFNYEVAFPSGSLDYKDLRELVYLSNPSGDFSEFENTYNSLDTTAYSMRQLILSMVRQIKSRYGL